MRLLVLVDQMAVGGGGRVASIMLRGLAANGHEILLETDVSKGFLYEIPESVKTVQVQYTPGHTDLPGRIKQFIRRIKGRRNNIRNFKPDAIVAYLPLQFTDALLANIGTGIPLIVSDHTAMSRDLGKWTNFIRHHLYGLADCATILTEKDRRYLGSRVKCKEVVYNPLTFTPIENLDNYAERRKNILCVGRISSWSVKGFDRIIKIWGHISARYTEWTLEIAGPGSDDKIAELNTMAHEAGCADSLKFLGNISDIKSLYLESSIFALPSRVEGFPMALIEAMSQGCACVSFDLDGAISEIANDNEDCLIVPDNDVEAFEKRLIELLDSVDLRKSIASAAIKNVSKYSEQRFVEHWLSILNRIHNK